MFIDIYNSSRPVRRIRLLGLFDTVNSVPRFESAWMQRTKFPYTARSSAKVIRHAVSIDERRAKFRQDLISGSESQYEDNTSKKTSRYEPAKIEVNGNQSKQTSNQDIKTGAPKIEISDSSNSEKENQGKARSLPSHSEQLAVPGQVTLQSSSESLAGPINLPSEEHHRSTARPQRRSVKHYRRRWSEAKRPQDIQEVWFAGGHADIGGGWKKTHDNEKMLSHTPLVWMVHEAERAGLRFDSR